MWLRSFAPLRPPHTPGTRLEQWGCDGGANQHWLVEPAGNGSYKLADSQDPTEVATLSGDHDAQGNPIVELAADSGSAAQQWQLTKLGIVYLG
ncbi:RICIN domain-containing protein [Kitasatospora acidiphila]|uniref:RICIN domain-containing protein n=1 Tax=Kitasatospora acidiphila TaxID=2567942 RepID=UPI003C77CA27